MTSNERYQKYIQEQCIVCKNKDTGLCLHNIKIWKDKDIIYTKCLYFKNENNKHIGGKQNGIQNK